MKRRKKSVNRNLLAVRMNERAPQKISKRWLWIGIATICSCLVVGLGASALTRHVLNQTVYENQDFTIKNIEVQVNGTISSAEIIQWAGVKVGQNIVSLNIDQVRQRLSAVPYIATASVERKLPHTLVIHVDERRPVALLQPKAQDGSKLAQAVYYLDAQGVVMRPKAGETLKQLPTIRGVDSRMVVEGLRNDVPEVVSALRLIRMSEISPVRLHLDLSHVDVQTRNYVLVKTHHQGWVRFRTDYLEQQLQRLQVIFDFARSENRVVRTVDLSPQRNVPVTFF